ncbi:hypothetical protein C8A05DRAFT_38686, partial [Staphylotrichum tortipilum]
MTPSERTWRDDLNLSDLGHLHTVETATAPSTKINDFFGLPPSSTPPAPDSRVPVDPILDAEMGPSWSLADPPRSSSATAHTIQTTMSSRLKGHPIWFTPPKNLATLALTLRLLPLTLLPIPHFLTTTLSTILFLTSAALYLPTTVLFLLRLILFPRATHRATVHERDTSGLELGYLASWPTGFVLLVAFGGFAVAEGRVGTGKVAEG